MNTEVARNLLDPVLEVVQRYVPKDYSDAIEQELRSGGIEAFLNSNTLWGGAGSIADQVGISEGREERRKVEALLINLGEFQISEGHCIQRTKMWVEAFKQWQRDGI